MSSQERTLRAEFSKGIIAENPIFVLLVGLCPALATSTSVNNAFAMGLAATTVLICSNLFISLIRRFIPREVRIPCFIVVIASFVTMVELAMRYVLSLAGVTSVLIGVETIEQLRENLRLVGRGPLPADVMVAVEQVIPDLPEEVVTPPLWPWNRG